MTDVYLTPENIQIKKEELQAEVQELVTIYNATSTIQNQRKQRFIELQGSLKTLQELNGDSNTSTDAT
jgi:hypothetical protein